MDSSLRPASWSRSARWFSTAASRCRSPNPPAGRHGPLCRGDGLVHGAARRLCQRETCERGDGGRRVRVVRRQRDAPLERLAERVEVAPDTGDQSDQPFRKPRKVRVAGLDRGGSGTGGGRRSDHEVPGTQRDDAALGQRPGAQVVTEVRRSERGLEVAVRGREVAAPAVDATEGDLDLRQLAGAGKGGGCLECGDRPGILAEARA